MIEFHYRCRFSARLFSVSTLSRDTSVLHYAATTSFRPRIGADAVGHSRQADASRRHQKCAGAHGRPIKKVTLKHYFTRLAFTRLRRASYAAPHGILLIIFS